jgi:nicotinate-nucleotide adenylyltransferase
VIVAIFGGSFNPPHVAHVLASALVLSTQPIDRLLVVPTYQHPFAKTLAPYDDRVAMCELAMGWLPRVEVSRVEEELGGESKTLRTLEHLAKLHADWSMRLVIGADILIESSKWFGFDRIRALAPLIVLGRIGVAGTAAPEPVLPAVSSTECRAAIAEGRARDLEMLVPREVLAHIEAKKLYRDGAGGARRS